MDLTLSLDGEDYILRIPRRMFRAMGGEPFERRPLRQREREVFNLVRMGKCNKEIAVVLGIEVRTVKMHVSNLLAIFQLRNRTELILLR